MDGRQVAEEVYEMDDDRPSTTKHSNLTDLGRRHPQGCHRSKALKFRQYILEHVRQMRRPLNRENARRYWMGELQKEIADRENF